jgi:hypothetical protein
MPFDCNAVICKVFDTLSVSRINLDATTTQRGNIRFFMVKLMGYEHFPLLSENINNYFNIFVHNKSDLC